jgi:hypothetical protein
VWMGGSWRSFPPSLRQSTVSRCAELSSERCLAEGVGYGKAGRIGRLRPRPNVVGVVLSTSSRVVVGIGRAVTVWGRAVGGSV